MWVGLGFSCFWNRWFLREWNFKEWGLYLLLDFRYFVKLFRCVLIIVNWFFGKFWILIMNFLEYFNFEVKGGRSWFW